MTTLEEDARFDAALEECRRRVRRGEALETCLAGQPVELRDELARLLPLATTLARIGRDPSPVFEAQLEQRLLASMEDARRAGRVGALEMLSRVFLGSVARVGAVAALAVVVLVAGGMGTVQASAGSLPDSPLYRVKAAVERVQLALARDQESQVAVRANQMDARGRELEQAVKPGKQRQVAEAVAARASLSTEKMVDQALDRAAQGKLQPAVRALVTLRTAQRRLAGLETQASPETRPVIQQLRTFLRQQERRLLQAAPGVAPGRAGVVSPAATPR